MTMQNASLPLIVRDLGHQSYQPVWDAMRTFTQQRSSDCADEIWFVEHPPVFTQGQAGKAEHILNPHDIPVIPVDRGGQVTYHGPGQLVGYILVDLRRQGFGVRDLVTHIEQAIIELLAKYQIGARARADAPGVYVKDDKICSLGLRIRRGCSYHGLALNVNMDLTPFSYINPCGLTNIRMTQIHSLNGPSTLDCVRNDLLPMLAKQLRYTKNHTRVFQDWREQTPAATTALNALKTYLINTATTVDQTL